MMLDGCRLQWPMITMADDVADGDAINNDVVLQSDLRL